MTVRSRLTGHLSTFSEGVVTLCVLGFLRSLITDERGEGQVLGTVFFGMALVGIGMLLTAVILILGAATGEMDHVRQETVSLAAATAAALENATQPPGGLDGQGVDLLREVEDQGQSAYGFPWTGNGWTAPAGVPLILGITLDGAKIVPPTSSGGPEGVEIDETIAYGFRFNGRDIHLSSPVRAVAYPGWASNTN